MVKPLDKVVIKKPRWLPWIFAKYWDKNIGKVGIIASTEHGYHSNAVFYNVIFDDPDPKKLTVGYYLATDVIELPE